MAKKPNRGADHNGAQAFDPPDYFLPRREVLKRLGITSPTLWAWERKGLFPRARQVGPRRVGYLSSEFNTWMQSRPPSPIKGGGVDG